MMMVMMMIEILDDVDDYTDDNSTWYINDEDNAGNHDEDLFFAGFSLHQHSKCRIPTFKLDWNVFHE
jgi:hypothetical protein